MTTAAVAAVHQASSVPDSVVLIVSAGLRQSSEVAGKVRHLWKELALVKTGDNQTTLTAENGSRVISLPASESTVRGFSADLLILDEASSDRRRDVRRRPTDARGHRRPADRPVHAVRSARVVVGRVGERRSWVGAVRGPGVQRRPAHLSRRSSRRSVGPWGRGSTSRSTSARSCPRRTRSSAQTTLPGCSRMGEDMPGLFEEVAR